MSVCPLTEISTPDDEKVRRERTGAGWHFPAGRGLKAHVRGSRDSIACRIAPGEDREVVQLGIGPTSSRLCNALYSARRDTALVFKAEALVITPRLGRGAPKGFQVSCAGPLTITVLRDFMRIHRGQPWFKPLDRRKFPRPPAGWCSWYCYYLDINEEEVVKNTDWLAMNLKQYGCRWVQIDDGWQGCQGHKAGKNRDWFVSNDADFPHGMKWAADYIREKGLCPGIWCIPFTESDTEMWDRERAAFVHDEGGGTPGELDETLGGEWMPEDERDIMWAGRYFIDATAPAGQAHLRRLFEMLCDQWGYEYVKIDGQGMMPGFYEEHRKRLCDPGIDGDRAYRAGLALMREVMGPGRFLLNCGHGWPGVGLCQGIRIGGDVGPSWQGMQKAIDSTMQYLYLNTIAFYTDPDVVCVREPLTLDQARVWATLVGVTGQLLMASDKMHELPEERVELLRRIFPVADIHPMELCPLDAEAKPCIFDVKVNLPAAGEWDVVALFNWGEQERTFDLDPARLGLDPDAAGWICMDGWTGEHLGTGDGRLSIEAPPTACRVVTYWPDLGRPQFVSASRHLTQGATDAISVKWDPARLRLSGTLDVTGGDPTRVRVHVPAGWRPATRGATLNGRIIELDVSRPKNGRARWRVAFEPAAD